MIVKHRKELLAATVLAAWTGIAAPAAADWLVTRDGARVETRGPWEVKGRQVVFKLAMNGTLSALRLSEVDLEASAAATAESQEESAPAAPDAEPPPRRSVLVITNEDLMPAAGREDAAQEALEEDEAQDEAEEAAAETAPRQQRRADAAVEIGSWSANPSEQVDGLEIVGTIRNAGSDLAANISVTVKIPDEDGAVFFEATAFVSSTGLAAGRETTFRALLPGIFQLPADPVFEIRASAVSIIGHGRPAPPPPSGNPRGP